MCAAWGCRFPRRNSSDRADSSSNRPGGRDSSSNRPGGRRDDGRYLRPAVFHQMRTTKNRISVRAMSTYTGSSLAPELWTEPKSACKSGSGGSGEEGRAGWKRTRRGAVTRWGDMSERRNGRRCPWRPFRDLTWRRRASSEEPSHPISREAQFTPDQGAARSLCRCWRQSIRDFPQPSSVEWTERRESRRARARADQPGR
jgi:hypothetical protein